MFLIFFLPCKLFLKTSPSKGLRVERKKLFYVCLPPRVTYVQGTCECATKLPPPPIPDRKLNWRWCAVAGGQCECEGRMRFGHTGFKHHYANNSKFFRENEDLERWSSRDVEKGSYPCNDDFLLSNTPRKIHTSTLQIELGIST